MRYKMNDSQKRMRNKKNEELKGWGTKRTRSKKNEEYKEWGA